MDWPTIFDKLAEEFNDPTQDIRDVADEAIRLAQSGEFENDFDKRLTADIVVTQLANAQRPVKEAWNWWMGELEYVEGGYEKYQF